MKTVKIRICVVVDEQGKWNAFGYSAGGLSKESDDKSKEIALDGFEDSKGVEMVYWVEAEVPIPTPTNIFQGSVAK